MLPKFKKALKIAGSILVVDLHPPVLFLITWAIVGYSPMDIVSNISDDFGRLPGVAVALALILYYVHLAYIVIAEVALKLRSFILRKGRTP